ncbi:MAG: molybdenum cofactor biosynthesis protein MoaE [Pseudomonadota bacterium]|jgi:molybdopterin synthase catalytic subunit
MIKVIVQAEPFDSAAALARLSHGRSDIGAIVSFTGLVRGTNDKGMIQAITLEHYPAMTGKQLARIAARAQERWPLLGGIIIHRHGRLCPGEPIVLVAIAAAHRAAAFAAASFIMDYLKTEAPFWKKETSSAGEQWVASRSTDETARARWQDGRQNDEGDPT